MHEQASTTVPHEMRPAEVLEFAYKPNPRAMLLAIAFFGVCAALGAYAATRGQGLIINGLVELSPRGAAVFWWCLSALSVAFVAGGSWGLHRSRTATLPVRLSATELSAPRNGFARRATTIPLREIHDVSVGAYGKQRWLVVSSPAASLNIMESMLPDRASFETLHQALVARVQGKGG